MHRTWTLAALLLLAAAPASAQVGRDSLRRAQVAMEAGDAESAIPDFERALRELPRSSALRRDALVGLARAQIAAGDEEAAHATIDALEAFDEDRPAASGEGGIRGAAIRGGESHEDDSDGDGIDIGWLIVGVTLAVSEVGLLVAGASLFAGLPDCEPTAPMCDRSLAPVATGLLVAGSLWWMVPAAVFGLLGVLSGDAGAAPFSRAPDPALVRF